MTEPLVSALSELNRRSEEVTAQVTSLSGQLEDAREDLTRINQARAALAALLGASGTSDEGEIGVLRQAEERSVTATSPMSEADLMSPPPGGRPRTVDAARALLMDFAEQDVDLARIRAGFRDRGWLDPDAKAPDALVYAGLRRLEREDPHVVRTTKKTWRYSADPDRVPRYTTRSAAGALMSPTTDGSTTSEDSAAGVVSATEPSD